MNVWYLTHVVAIVMKGLFCGAKDSPAVQGLVIIILLIQSSTIRNACVTTIRWLITYYLGSAALTLALCLVYLLFDTMWKSGAALLELYHHRRSLRCMITDAVSSIHYQTKSLQHRLLAYLMDVLDAVTMEDHQAALSRQCNEAMMTTAAALSPRAAGVATEAREDRMRSSSFISMPVPTRKLSGQALAPPMPDMA